MALHLCTVALPSHGLAPTGVLHSKKSRVWFEALQKFGLVTMTLVPLQTAPGTQVRHETSPD